jgi:hypothetical protein
MMKAKGMGLKSYVEEHGMPEAYQKLLKRRAEDAVIKLNLTIEVLCLLLGRFPPHTHTHTAGSPFQT